MKTKLIMAFALIILIAVVIGLGIVLRLTTPEKWPILAGTLKVEKVVIGNQPFVMVEGEPMNYLGQIQSINIEFDNSGKRLVVSRCLIRWNPFSKIVVNNQWPVFYPLADLKPGKYAVVYESTEGETAAGSLDVP